jgi:NAD(P)-dependent dehydrogenase (short-subunit alcohol dehydrogenase family)
MHTKELLSLKDKVAVVTGGAGLYGSCIVEGLAEADATVITASRNLEAGEAFARSLRDKDLDVHARRLDQADHASVLELKERITADFGGLDVFVNNAVARPVSGGWDGFTLEDVTESMRVNAVGMMDITREMADLIAKRGGGTIVNIASMMGMFGPDLSNYEGTDMGKSPSPDYFFHRAGMINFTRYLAHILADRKIRVNCISPGGFGTPNHPQRFVENYTKKVMVGRLAVHDDIKGVVVFLASRASSYVTGENILMDGGMHC